MVERLYHMSFNKRLKKEVEGITRKSFTIAPLNLKTMPRKTILIFLSFSLLHELPILVFQHFCLYSDLETHTKKGPMYRSLGTLHGPEKLAQHSKGNRHFIE